MSIIVDIIILAIVLLSIFIGYKRGLIKCAINVLSFFIAIIVVILLTTPISNLIINNTKIDDNIRETISKNITFNNDDGELKLDENNSNSPTVVIEYINNMMTNAASDTTKSVADALAENITIMIINIGVAVVLFIGTKFALMFVKVVADIIGKIPLIKQFNNAGGAIYGVASGIVRVYLILAVISILAPLFTDSSIIQAVNDSMIGSGMYNNNILLKIIL